jgi:TM2 domain-containing membrane protein YozV
MSDATIKEVATWTPIFVLCGVFPFVISIIVDSGKLGFIATIIDALK